MKRGGLGVSIPQGQLRRCKFYARGPCHSIQDDRNTTIQIFTIGHHLPKQFVLQEHAPWKISINLLQIYSFIGFNGVCMLFLLTMNAKKTAPKQRGYVPLKHAFIFSIVQMTS